MPIKRRISVKKPGNFKTFLDFKLQGWNYIINPNTGVLHSLKVSDYLGFHNFKIAKFEHFYPVVDVGENPITNIPNGEVIELFDINTQELIAAYSLNKCICCFQ